MPGKVNRDRSVVGLAVPQVSQVTMPAQGARVVVASGAFWQSVNMTHAVKMVRRNTVQEAPVKMQLASTRTGDLKEDPTILIVDLVPGASQTGVLSLEKTTEQWFASNNMEHSASEARAAAARAPSAEPHSQRVL